MLLRNAARGALADAGSTRWVGFTVHEERIETFSQERRGRPGGETRYRKKVKSVFRLDASVNADTTTYDAATDGCFPLITNADDLAPAEVLKSYRDQPNLERRNHVLKGPQLAAPVFIEHPHRIEGISLCHFIAMLTGALIEREVRNSMQVQELKSIPLYPESRDCPSPSTPSILEIFADARRDHLVNDGRVVKDFDPELSPLCQQVLELLHVPASVYASPKAI